ncbi:PBP1A family penicillin-binding protein [Pseudooceanicola sp. CBS1P-1]|uniref:Penicillin-binding protein 1A n=1 Tax=Pseudooceanicola albus TaxID=2692189 RepID=A0A6L7G109_9RHOB|nr:MULTISPECIES: PBP1A family penicillin-binding protein [Pseudooceanicola]MBT9382639.1 PBP1A family penicillin-binding protein [Pseudooceanicola endophyticus]MXN17178.1 PBP1A family penicillin-binding protein [Pseudooceanicola albus]
MIRFILSFFGGIFTLVTLGLAMVALSVGAIFWVYGRDLPSHESLAQYQPKTISRIYNGEGQLIDEFAKERRLYTPADEIPKLVKDAFISAEDKNFYTHQGYDPRGIAAAILEAIETRGKTVRGASTIPQQVAKNLFLSGDRKIERKVKEVILASRLVDSMSKDKILEIYLNEIYLGQNSYGVAAAAQTYFNKTLNQLDPAEAAILASMPKAPSDYHPVRQHDRLLARRNYVLQQMYENGYIDKATYDKSLAEPIRSVQGGDYPAFRVNLPPRDYFTDEIRRQLSRDFGAEEFFTAGFSVRATEDPDMQRVAAIALRHSLERMDRQLGKWRGTGKTIPAADLGDEAKWRAALSSTNVARDIEVDGKWHPAVVLKVSDQSLAVGIEDVPLDDPRGNSVPRSDIKWMHGDFHDNFKPGDVIFVREAKAKSGKFDHWSVRQVPEVEGGFMAMDVNNGRVIAMQGGFSYQHSVFNRATQANRQPGSSFKPFVYAAALDSGYTPATIVVDAPIEVNTPDGVWRPTNSENRYYGPTPLRIGIEMSRNLMTIRLAQEVGMDTVASYAERFGVYDHMGHYLANALGSEETTLYKMVAAYAMFANGGERVEPTLVDRVQDRYGRTIYRHDQRVCEDCGADALPRGEGPRILSNRERVMNAITAYQLTSMMEGVVQRGTASRAVHLPVPIAGKTGTTNGARDAWFIGFSSNIVAGCYIGYDTPRPMLGGHGYGASLCAPVFQEFMTQAIKKYGGSKFKVPPGGHFINIDRYTGARLPDDASGPNVQAEYFRDGEDPIFGVTYDGGFAMGQDLPLYKEAEQAQRQITTSTGETTTIGPRANFGTLSSGGLY